MKKRTSIFIPIFLLCLVGAASKSQAQEQTKDTVAQTKEEPEKMDVIPLKRNIIRYNLSGSFLLGFDKSIVFGYERIVNKNQSFSINVGSVALAKSRRDSVSGDEFRSRNEPKSSGFNLSFDYRFYLRKENKYGPPRGAYIGPYFSYNHFLKENSWSYDSAHKTVNSRMSMNIYTAGIELGYQLLLWKRFAVDFVLVGPGIGYYKINLKTTAVLTEDERQKLGEAVKQVITEKLPGLNYVLENKHFDNEGTAKTWSLGYRYIIHIGFLF